MNNLWSAQPVREKDHKNGQNFLGISVLQLYIFFITMTLKMTTYSYFYLAHESPNVIIKCSDTYALLKSPCWAEMRSGSLYNEPWQTLNLKWPLRGLISSTEGFSEQFSGNGLDYEFPTQGHKDVCSKGCHKANGLKQKSEGGFPVAQSWTEMQGLYLGTASSMCFYLFVSFCFCQKNLGLKFYFLKR